MKNETKVGKNHFYISQLNEEDRRILYYLLDYGFDLDMPWKILWDGIQYQKYLNEEAERQEQMLFDYWEELRNGKGDKDSDNPEI